MNVRSFLKAGHMPTLFCAFLYFDISFMVWVLLGALANSIVPEFQMSETQRGLMLAFPLLGGSILRLVLGESLLLALIGGIPGIIIAALMIYSIRDSLMNFVPLMSLSPDIVLAALALMLALGLLTGLIPALSAMRLKIASALGRS